MIQKTPIDRLTSLMNELATAPDKDKPRIVKRIHALHGLQRFLDKLRSGELKPEDVNQCRGGQHEHEKD